MYICDETDPARLFVVAAVDKSGSPRPEAIDIEIEGLQRTVIVTPAIVLSLASDVVAVRRETEDRHYRSHWSGKHH